jgi:hypothetical protein
MYLVFASSRLLVFSAALLAATSQAAAQGAARPTSPRAFFGHEIGADYVLPNYTRFVQYFERLARESDRMELDTIGRTEEGRPQLMAIVSSPANLANKERYRQISERLSRAEGLTDAQARQLASEGKAVVWIDGGLHATEVLGAQQLIETTWQLVSGTDAETTRFLNDCIVLLVHANPDGMELVSNWYMRNPDSLQRSTGAIPRLYEKYAGHDNNRDFYMNNTAEARNVSRVMYTVWYPQIMYNHHQTGPQGAVMFAPPFRDPMNYNLHPLMKTGLDFVGAAIHQRMIQEKKGGTVMRSGANYSTWWNGGLRTTAYFHNQVGILTETIGNPTPISVPFVARMQLPFADVPLPVKPGPWKFRQSIDYSVTANKAILDLASRMRETWLFNIYAMGRDAIAAGNTDTWTTWPREMIALGGGRGGRGGRGGGGGGGGGGGRGAPSTEPDPTWMALRSPENRDPRGYIISADQPDFGTATKFVQTLQRTGLDVMRATADFTVNGKRYPTGSFVVMTAQSFRPMVMDMFEPQDHPDDFAYPGAPPTRPYDNAGWTVALQMGVQVDRVLDGFTGPFAKVPRNELVTPLPRTIAMGGEGYLIDPRQNDAVVLANRLLKANAQVFRTTGAGSVSQGTWFIPRSAVADPIVAAAGRTLGLRVTSGARPANVAQLRAPRVGLFDRYGGMMPAGWTRYILERFEIPFEDVYPQQLDAGNLNQKYDVLVFVSGSISGGGGGRGGGGGGGGRGAAAAGGDEPGGRGGGGRGEAIIPAEFAARQGTITPERTIPQIKSFLEAGGRVVTIGGSTSLAQMLQLPIENHLVENGADLPATKFYSPGSLHEVAVDTTLSLASGMPAKATVFFDNSPVFKLGSDAAARGIRAVARYESDAPLRSGWAWGQAYLKDGVSIVEARVGQGSLYLFGPEILFRAQPHGTYKFLFNGLYPAR